MTGIVLLLAPLLGGCDNSAADRLRTCEGGNTQACLDDGMRALAAAKPQFGEARKALSAACRPSVGTNAGSAISQARPLACNELALLVRDAKGGPKDVPRALDLFGIACKDGLDRACVDLAGLLYSEKADKTEDAVRAVVLFDAACGKVDVAHLPDDGPHELSEACAALGRAYEVGVGVEPARADPEKAAALYTKSCESRYAPGCVSSGNLLVASNDIPARPLGAGKTRIADAAALYERACKLDAHVGCFELAELHANKAWPEATDALAAEYYKKTCAIDPTRGCFEAGALMEEGRVEDHEGEIDSLYNVACDHGSSIACERRANRR